MLIWKPEDEELRISRLIAIDVVVEFEVGESC